MAIEPEELTLLEINLSLPTAVTYNLGIFCHKHVQDNTLCNLRSHMTTAILTTISPDLCDSLGH